MLRAAALCVGLAGTGGAAAAPQQMNRWSDICAGWDGPTPLQEEVNNTELDCQLKQLALKFGLEALGGGPSRAAELGPRLADALNVAACNGSVGLPWLAAEPAASRAALGSSRLRQAVVGGMARRAGCPTAEVLELYVAKDGSDAAGTGSVTHPFATIARALQQVAPPLPARTRPVAVWLRAGKYHEGRWPSQPRTRAPARTAQW